MQHSDRRRALALALGTGLLTPLLRAGGGSPLATPDGAATAFGLADDSVSYPIRLNFNENPWGPGPAARAAVAAAMDDGCRYANTGKLIAAIAAREGVQPEQIAIGSGSGELLNMLAFGWAARGVVTCAWPTFDQLMAFAAKAGAEVRRVPLDSSLRHDLAAIEAAAPDDNGLVYLCNPNNPTGTVIEGPRLRAHCRALAQRTLVVVDEAYMDLIEPGATESMVDLVRETANVVILRTFSKVHGLAGLRVGYAISRPEHISRLRELQMASPNVLGLAAATASLADTAFIAASRERIVTDRRRVTAACRKLGMECSDSHGNFVFVRTGVPVAEFRERMRALGIEVGRPFAPLTDWCRISLGRTAENTALIAALAKFRAATDLNSAT
jgi:histidinol-phosphate aminotransferase